MYIPKPIDTKNISLSEDLLKLAETIAENVHDNWSAGRLSEGWSYGPARDDKKKTTPCLVPYSELPESEKEYDRTTAMETLKAIIAFGYKIEKQ